MPQVSRRTVAKDVEVKLTYLFEETLKVAAKDDSIIPFLKSLLTTTEKKMLAKRIAVAFMLQKGLDYLAIGETLKVSKQTIWSIKKDVEDEKSYCLEILKILNKEKNDAFWKKLDIAIMEALPPPYRTDWSTRGKELIKKKHELTKGF